MTIDTDEHEPLTDEEREHWRQVRIAGIQREGAIRRQPCPRCEAQVGEPCHRKPSFYTTPYHKARLVAAGVR